MKKERAMGKTFGKMLIWLIVGAVVGGLAGWSSVQAGSAGIQEGMSALYSRFLAVGPVVQLVVFAAYGGVCFYFYRKAEALRKKGTEEAEDRAGDYLNYAMTVNSAGLAVLFLLFGLVIDKNNTYINVIAGMVIFLVTAVLSMVLEILIIYQAKRLDPMKKGDPGDMRFMKDWMQSCDEAEKMLTYQAAYETFAVMKTALLAAHVIALFGKISFGTGNLPIVLTSGLWFLNSLVYSIKSMKLEKTRIR